MNLITAEKARELTEEAKVRNLNHAVNYHIETINSKIINEAESGRESIDYQVMNQEECDAVMEILKSDPYKYQVEQCTPNTFSSPFTIRIRWYDKKVKKRRDKMVTCVSHEYANFTWYSDGEIIARLEGDDLEIINKSSFDDERKFANADDTYDQASRKAWFPEKYDQYEEGIISSILNGNYNKENPRKHLEATRNMLAKYGVKV